MSADEDGGRTVTDIGQRRPDAERRRLPPRHWLWLGAAVLIAGLFWHFGAF